MATVYHMVHYRRFGLEAGKPPGKLEALCRAALDQADATGMSLWKRVKSRVYTVQSAAGREIVLNRVADLQSAVFGEMCLVEKDGLQALMGLNVENVELSELTTAEIFNLEEREAPKGSQFIRGMAYWLAIGDHLFFVKTNQMSPENIREYLEWLLRSGAASLPAGRKLQLQAEFDKSLNIGEIKSLRVKGGAAPQYAVVPDGFEQQVSTARRIADRFVEFSQALPVVEALFGPAKTKSLVESLGPGEYFSVDASVKVRGRRTEKSKAKFVEIARDLADAGDGEVKIEGKDGRVSEGDAILRTRMPFELGHEAANLLDFDNAADQLQEVYKRFVKDKKIDA